MGVAKAVLCEGTGQVYSSIAQAAYATGTTNNSIMRSVKHAVPVAGNLWKYASPDDVLQAKADGTFHPPEVVKRVCKKQHDLWSRRISSHLSGIRGIVPRSSYLALGKCRGRDIVALSKHHAFLQRPSAMDLHFCNFVFHGFCNASRDENKTRILFCEYFSALLQDLSYSQTDMTVLQLLQTPSVVS
eukprot:g13203.t1